MYVECSGTGICGMVKHAVWLCWVSVGRIENENERYNIETVLTIVCYATVRIFTERKAGEAVVTSRGRQREWY